jgi:hypothetical protein
VRNDITLPAMLALASLPVLSILTVGLLAGIVKSIASIASRKK